MPRPTGPQFDMSKLEEHIMKYQDDDSGYFGPPKRGELPNPGTTIYHGVEPSEVGALPGSTGIHWSTRPSVAAEFATQKMTPVIAAVVEDPERQVIPRLHLQHANPQDKEGGDIVLDREQEYHVRPGARLRVTNRDELLGLGMHVPEHIGVDHPQDHEIKYVNLDQFRVRE